MSDFAGKRGRATAAAIALLAMLTFSACGGGSKPSAEANAGDPVYGVGETAALFDFKLTVDGAETASEYNRQVLQPGTTFVLVHVTLENAGSESKTYNSSSFKLLDSSGKTDLSVTTLDGEGELHIGELAPGEKASGVLPYEHPADDGTMTLTFQPNAMSDRTIRFDLGKK